MSKKIGRIMKAPGELVALGTAPGAAGLKKEPSAPQPVGTSSRALAPPEKRQKMLSGVSAKSISKKLPGDLSTVKRESSDSLAPSFDIEQFYSLVSGSSLLSTSQTDLLLKRCALFIPGNVAKLENNFISSLFYLASDRPELFRSSIVFTAFSMLLHSKSHSSQDRKTIAIPPVIAANVLYLAYRDESCWPSEVIAFYIEDALGDRIWVDRPECSVLVFTIVKAFSTRLPPHLEESIRGSVMKKGFKTVNESIIGFQQCLYSIHSTMANEIDQNAKFLSVWDSVGVTVSDFVRDFIAKKQTGEVQLQNLLKVMLLSCCFAEVRKIASEKLEFWLQNQKIVKLAQDLLMTVCMNSNGETVLESETITAIIKLKYASKQKHLSSHFLSCIRQLLSSNPQLARKLIVQHVGSLELNPPPANAPKPVGHIGLLDAAFSVDGGWAVNHILADYFGEVIMTWKEDPLRGIRSALRNIYNGVKSQQLSLKVIVDVLMRLTDKSNFDRNIRDRIIVSVADVVCLSQQLCVTELVQAAYDDRTEGDRSTIQKFQEQVAFIQLSAIRWWFSLKPIGESLGTGLKNLLMMDSPVSYTHRDGWPAEPERSKVFEILTSFVPATEAMCSMLIQCPLAMEQHFYSYQLQDILLGLLKRNARCSRQNLPACVPVRNADLVQVLLDQSKYHVDKSYGEYHPLAVTSIYWKAWQVVVVCVALNPSGLGASFWQRFPTLRYLMEMCMTACYQYPSVAALSSHEIVMAEEKKIADDERQAIHMLSQKLNASLGNQVMYFDPIGPARRPPEGFFSEVRKLNDEVGIGAMLCKSRDPDFLQALTTQSQTAGRAMPWLRNLIMNTDDALYVLPTHCICQFVLEVEQQQNGKQKAEFDKCSQIFEQMAQLVEEASSMNATQDTQARACNVIVNFVQRLSSLSAQQRNAARRCLSKICKSPSIEGLFELQIVKSSRQSIVKGLHQALSVELDCSNLSQYFKFLLSANFKSIDASQQEPLVVDVCRFLVERRSLSIEGASSILPVCSESWNEEQIDLHEKLMNLLIDYLSSVINGSNDVSVVDPDRHVKVEFAGQSPIQRIFYIVVVEAAVLLVALKSTQSTAHEALEEMWFNQDSKLRPSFRHVIDDEQMLSRGNPFKSTWLRQLLLNSSQSLLVDTVFSYCSSMDLIGLVRTFGLSASVTSRILSLLDSHCLASPTLANELMPTGDTENARFVLKCAQIHQKRLNIIDQDKKPGQQFISSVSHLLVMKKQQLAKQKLKPVETGSTINAGPASPMKEIEEAPESPDVAVATSNQQFDSVFQLKSAFKLISDLNQNNFNAAGVLDNVEKELNDSAFAVREFALASPSVCSLLFNGLYSNPQVDKPRYIELVKRIYRDFGRDWRQIIDSSDLKENQEIAGFIRDFDELSKQQQSDMEQDGGDIASPVAEPDSVSTDIGLEIESSSARRVCDLIFFSNRYSLGDGLRLCSLVFERRDAKSIWEIVSLLLETKRSELPSDCRLIFGFIDSALRRSSTLIGPEITGDLRHKLLPDLTRKQLENVLEIADRSFVDNPDAVVDLVTILLSKNLRYVDVFDDWVNSKLTSQESGHLLASRLELSLKLYAKVPGLWTRLLTRNGLIRNLSSLQHLQSSADSTVKTILLSMGSQDSKRGWLERVREATSLCRVVAVAHPALILNNLGLVAALMQGRNTAVSFSQFRAFHIPTLINFVNILSLLQPAIFASRHKQALQVIVDALFEIFETYMADVDGMRGLVGKATRFVLAISQTNLPLAITLLVPNHRVTISKMRRLLQQSESADLEALEHSLDSRLVTGVQPLASEDASNFGSVFESELSCGDASSPEIHDLIERLERRRHSIEALLSILTEIEVFTRYRPNQLVHFGRHLIELLYEPSSQVVNKSQVLLERLLRNHSGSRHLFDEWFAAFNQAASNKSTSADIVNCFLKSDIFDMCSMSPDRTVPIVELLWKMLTNGRLSSSPDAICRCLKQLNCEASYST